MPYQYPRPGHLKPSSPLPPACIIHPQRSPLSIRRRLPPALPASNEASPCRGYPLVPPASNENDSVAITASMHTLAPMRSGPPSLQLTSNEARPQPTFNGARYAQLPPPVAPPPHPLTTSATPLVSN